MILTSNSEIMLVLNSLICIILIIATISNSLLLLVFHRRPGLRTISNRFVINLLVTNLITCWILLPLLLFNNCWQKAAPTVESKTTNDDGHYGLQCAVFEGIAIGLCVACVLSVLMISIDQYFAVIDPLRYHSSIKATTLLVMMVISWTVAIGFGLFGGASANRNCTWYVCERLDDNPPAVIPKIYQITFSILFAVFAFVVPFAAICWIYSSICSAAHGNYQRTKRSNGSSTNGGAVQDTGTILDCASNVVSTVHQSVECDPRYNRKPHESTPRPIHHSSTKSSLKSTSSSIVNSLRHRISNGSMFRYREETRAARISASVIVMALFCWLPFTVLLLIRSPLLGGHVTVPSYVKQMGILSLCANAVFSPLIFAHRKRRIHRELCRLFGVSRRRRTSYYTDNNNLNVRRDSLKKRFAPSESRVEAATTTVVADESNYCYFTSAICRKTLVDVDNGGRRCSVSILNRVWRIATEPSEHERNGSRLPEVASETETSRSSFSSNTSGGSDSNRQSTSPASLSDTVAERV